MKSSYKNFLKQKDLTLKKLIGEYEQGILKARDKSLKHRTIYNQLNNEHRVLQSKLASNSRIIIESEDAYALGDLKEMDELFDERIKVLKNKKEIIDLLAQLYGISEFFNYWKKMDSVYRELTEEKTVENPIEKNISPLIWCGENSTEFLQLIYSLYEAGLVTNKSNKKTELVSQFAKAFNVKLSDNWQSNLSKSINERNYNYVPEIFERIKKSFIRYRDRQLAKNK